MPVSAQVSKTEILRYDAEAGRIPSPPGHNGPLVRARRALARWLVGLGNRLDDSRAWRPVPLSEPPCP